MSDENLKTYDQIMSKREELKNHLGRMKLIHEIDVNNEDYIHLEAGDDGNINFFVSAKNLWLTPENLMELRDVLNKWFPNDKG